MPLPASTTAARADDAERYLVPRLVHELRGPLDGMRRLLSLAVRDDCAPEQRERYLAACRQGVERLVDIVDTLACSCAGTGSRVPRAADVNELVRQAVQFHECAADERAIRFALDLAEGLPAVPRGSGLFQVFCNLLSNACDAMAKAGGSLTISTKLEDGHVAVRFRDTGPGMPADVLPHVFTPFFTTKPPGDGMGLGLAVCQEIVSRLKGRIEVASEPGSGTTFVVVVPCATRRATKC